MRATGMDAASSQRPGQQTLVVFDGDQLLRDCLVETLRLAFQDLAVTGIGSLDELAECQRTMAGRLPALLLVRVSGDALPRGLAAAAAITRMLPETPVAIVGPCQGDADVAAAAGVQAIIPANSSLQIGLAALRLVLAGGTYFPLRPCAAASPQNGNATHHASDRQLRAEAEDFSAGSGLTNGGHPMNGRYNEIPHPVGMISRGPEHGLHFTTREVEVLAALRRGRSNKCIAHDLSLSENTVKVYLGHIMRKLNATNRTEAVILAQKLDSGIHAN